MLKHGVDEYMIIILAEYLWIILGSDVFFTLIIDCMLLWCGIFSEICGGMFIAFVEAVRGVI